MAPALELEIDQPLPPLCSRHGRPEISRRQIRVPFFDSHTRRRSASAMPELSAETMLRQPEFLQKIVSTVVVGEWPVCDRCVRAARLGRRIAQFLYAVMAANLVAFVIVAAVKFEPLIIPISAALFPGSLPIGLLAAVWIAKKGSESVVFRPIYDVRFIFAQAHPRFRAAIDEDPRFKPPLG
ncbi:hypothetical protein ACWDYH_21560 [Nocardia goodfellowii]